MDIEREREERLRVSTTFRSISSLCIHESPQLISPIDVLFWNFRHSLVRYYWYHIGMTDIWFKKTGCTNGPTELQLFSTKQSLRSSGCRTLGRGFHRALVGAHGFIGASTRLACGSRCDGSPHKWAPGVYHFGPYPHQVTSVSWITILN